MNAALRAKSIIIDPRAEWQAIERENDDPAYVLTRYATLFAIIPSLFGFVGTCLIGTVAQSGAIVRTPLLDGLFGAIFGYVTACAGVLVVALVIQVLAPMFGGRRNFDSAFKLSVYSFTPAWLAGIFLLLPGLHFLVLLGFYGLYILWLGLPRLAKVPDQMSLTFAIAITVGAAALVYTAATVQHTIFGTPGI
jgi:Yip1 domain